MSVASRKNKAGRIISYRARPQANGKDVKGFCKTFKVVDYATSAKAKKEANTYCDEIEKKLDGYRLEDEGLSKRITLHQALSEYWIDVGQHTNDEASLRNRINMLKRHKISSLSLAGLTVKDITNLKNELYEKKAASTVINDLSPISAAIKHAKAKHEMYYLTNVYSSVVMPSAAGNERDRRLDSSEKRRLLTACDRSGNEYLGEVVRLAFELGLRQKRLVELTWKQVDLKKKVVRFSRSVVAAAAGNKRIPPFAPMSVRAFNILTRMYERTGDGEYVFPTTQNAIKLAFNKAKRVAELSSKQGWETNFNFHDTRHEAISKMYEERFTDIQIMMFTGIRSAQTLIRYNQQSEKEMVAERQAARQKRLERARVRKGLAEPVKLTVDPVVQAKDRLKTMCMIHNCSFSEADNKVSIEAPTSMVFKKTNQASIVLEVNKAMAETIYSELYKIVAEGVVAP